MLSRLFCKRKWFGDNKKSEKKQRIELSILERTAFLPDVAATYFWTCFSSFAEITRFRQINTMFAQETNGVITDLQQDISSTMVWDNLIKLSEDGVFKNLRSLRLKDTGIKSPPNMLELKTSWFPKLQILYLEGEALIYSILIPSNMKKQLTRAFFNSTPYFHFRLSHYIQFLFYSPCRYLFEVSQFKNLTNLYLASNPPFAVSKDLVVDLQKLTAFSFTPKGQFHHNVHLNCPQLRVVAINGVDGKITFTHSKQLISISLPYNNGMIEFDDQKCNSQAQVKWNFPELEELTICSCVMTRFLPHFQRPFSFPSLLRLHISDVLYRQGIRSFTLPSCLSQVRILQIESHNYKKVSICDHPSLQILCLIMSGDVCLRSLPNLTDLSLQTCHEPLETLQLSHLPQLSKINAIKCHFRRNTKWHIDPLPKLQVFEASDPLFQKLCTQPKTSNY